MADFFTLSCPSCGGKLQITNDIDRFACGYCGQEHTVNRSGGMVFLKPVVEGLRQVQTGVDKTAAELAIVRLEKEIAVLDEKLKTIYKNEPHKTSLNDFDPKWRTYYGLGQNWDDYMRDLKKKAKIYSEFKAILKHDEEEMEQFERLSKDYSRNKEAYEQKWSQQYATEYDRWRKDLELYQQKKNELLAELAKNKEIVRQ